MSDWDRLERQARMALVFNIAAGLLQIVAAILILINIFSRH